MESHHGQRSVEPKVSIIIPTRDKYDLLRACIESIQTKTTYRNYEIVVINNGSSEVPTIEYLELLRSTGITVLDYPHAFNYSKISNFGVASTQSDYLCFLNNDTQVMESSWLSKLLDHAVQPGVGIVGSKLVYADETVQHTGIALGLSGLAGHVHAGLHISSLPVTDCHAVAAVTFACAVFSRDLYNDVGILDESLVVGLNDVDYCIRVSTIGYTNLVCNKVAIIHHESKSRKSTRSLSGGTRAFLEIIRFLKKHPRYTENEIYFK